MRITIIKDYCKGCDYCIEYCPKKVYGKSKIMNKKGYLVPEVIDLENCSECGLCDMYCPEFAIILEKEEKKHERN